MKNDCDRCDGAGWYVQGETDNPRQVQCEACSGTGLTDPLHMPVECDVTECAEPPSIGATTSFVGPDGNRRNYMVVRIEPIKGGWHVHFDPI